MASKIDRATNARYRNALNNIRQFHAMLSSGIAIPQDTIEYLVSDFTEAAISFYEAKGLSEKEAQDRAALELKLQGGSFPEL